MLNPSAQGQLFRQRNRLHNNKNQILQIRSSIEQMHAHEIYDRISYINLS